MASKKAGKKASMTKPKRPKMPVPTQKPPRPVKPPKPVYPAPGTTPPLWADDKCNVPNICAFLEKLSNWLNTQFIPDYTALRIAVCNVEKQAFAGTGNANKPPRFCTGGGGSEPAPPPPPPVW